MLLRYTISLDDLVAFNRYHCTHSPTIQRIKYTSMAIVSLLAVVGAFVVPAAEGIRPAAVLFAVFFAGVFCLLFSYRFPRGIDDRARRLYAEGKNDGLLGSHELEVDERGIVERTTVSESRHAWSSIEKIEETDRYAFIYNSGLSAYVIPKDAISAGNFTQFIARARHLWNASKRP